jgi:hypothetical protein
MSTHGSLARGILPIALLLFNVTGNSAGSFQPGHAGATTHEQITVKIRNGRTGLPIWLASPYVYVGRVDPQHMAESRRKTAFWSDAHVDVTGANPRKVTVWVDFVDRDCRFATSDGAMYAADFDLDLVLSKGVVTPNLCSSKTQTPEPGVITMWVIPTTFKELWNE